MLCLQLLHAFLFGHSLPPDGQENVQQQPSVLEHASNCGLGAPCGVALSQQLGCCSFRHAVASSFRKLHAIALLYTAYMDIRGKASGVLGIRRYFDYATVPARGVEHLGLALTAVTPRAKATLKFNHSKPPIAACSIIPVN